MPKKKTTRNPQGGGTIRQRSDGRWEGRYTAGRNPGTGRQIQKSVYGDTQAEVCKKLQQIHASIDSGSYVEPSKLTVAQWMDIWLTDYLGGVKSATTKSYTEHTNNHIKPGLGAISLQKLSAHMIQGFYNRLQKCKSNKLGLAAKTIKNIHGVLHSALKQAVAIGYIRANPSESCILPRIEKRDMQVISDDKLDEFLTVIQKSPYQTLLYVALFTGMREGEIIGLVWDCVNFSTGEILINKQLQKDRLTGIYQLVSVKNDRPRRISPAKSVMESLFELRKKQSKKTNTRRCLGR